MPRLCHIPIAWVGEVWVFKKENIDFIVTTEKDYVKVQKFIKGNIPFYFLKIEGEIEDKNNFDKLLCNKINIKI